MGRRKKHQIEYFEDNSRERQQELWLSLYGAALGDICGSIYKHKNRKTENPCEIDLIDERCHFTDDTVLTAAVAHVVRKVPDHAVKARDFHGDWESCFCRWEYASYYRMNDERERQRSREENGKEPVWEYDYSNGWTPKFPEDNLDWVDKDYSFHLRDWAKRYPLDEELSYGALFWKWVKSEEPRPYGTYGNGAASRVSPVAWGIQHRHREDPGGSMMSAEYNMAFYYQQMMEEVRRATEATHSHPLAVLAAQSVCQSIYRSVKGEWKYATEGETRSFMDYFRDPADIRRRAERIASKCQERPEFENKNKLREWLRSKDWDFVKNGGRSEEESYWRELCQVEESQQSGRRARYYWSEKDMADFLNTELNKGVTRIPKLADLRKDGCLDNTCQTTVPAAVAAFLESHDFVSAIQNAISIGGESDTIAAITGSLAEAYYREIPEELKAFARSKLPEEIRQILGMERRHPQTGELIIF
jgi:ADP-ribosylglycohydrolase